MLLRYVDESQEFGILRRLCVGSEGKDLFTLDTNNRVKKRNINNTESSNVYTSEYRSLIFSIVCLRGNVKVPQRIALLLRRSDVFLPLRGVSFGDGKQQ